MDLKWLQSLYYSSSQLPREDEFYTNLLMDADFLANFPQVFQLLKEQGRLEDTPLFFRQHLKERYKESYYQNLFIKNQTVQILKAFEEQEILVIPLKGVFFSEKYFGHLGARITSDIDLLIKNVQLEKVIPVIKSLGFSVEEEEIDGHFHRSFSKELPGSEIPLTVELHWDLLKENTASLPIDEFWKQSRPLKPFFYIRELSDYHTFYMICLHGWRHNLDSLKFYLDIIQLIYRVGDQIDYGNLIADTTQHKTHRRITRTLAIVYQECPFLEKIKEFPYRDKKVYLSYKEKKNPRGRMFKKYKDFIDYQFLSYDTAEHRFRELISWLK